MAINSLAMLLVVLGVTEALMSTLLQKDEDQCRITTLGSKHLGHKGYRMDCSDANLTRVPQSLPPPNSSFTPPLRELVLSFNAIHVIENDSFVHIKHFNASGLMSLYLDNNRLNCIHSDAFIGLSNLRYLNLTSNNLHWPRSYATGLFRHLVLLENLSVKDNGFDNFTGLGHELQNLTNLQGLYINPKKGCKFGQDFEQLVSLVDVSLSGRNMTACKMQEITNDMFTFIPKVQKLWLSSCSIEYIDADAFSPLVNLILLDLSYNEKLGFKNMSVALSGLKNSSTLRTLNVNHINTFWEAGITLTATDMKNIKTLQNLETLHMDLNKIEVFSKDVLEQHYFPATLRNLTLSGNRLTYGQYVTYLPELKNVTLVDVSRQHLTYDPFFSEHFEPRKQFFQDDSSHTNIIHRYNTTENESKEKCLINLPPDLKMLKWRKSFIRTDLPAVHICNASSLHNLDLSFNMIYKWVGPVKGLESLKHLDLSDNTCNNVSEIFFSYFTSLKHLDISRNDLGSSFNPETNMHAGDILNQMKNLTRLDMSHLQLRNLSKNVFKELSFLEELNLSSNQLRDFDVDMSNIHCITLINISDNKLPNLKKPFMDYLDSLVNEECNRNKTVILDFSMNTLTCECADLPFWQWSLNTDVSLTMNNKDGCTINGQQYRFHSQRDNNGLLRDLEKFCKNNSWERWLTAGGGVLFGIVLSSILGLLVYNYRWKLRYLYYARSKRFRHEGFERLFANDAMISYAKSNASFIKDNLLPAMESRGLSVWVADKHSIPGASVAENIIHAIYTSRKTVLLVDREYTKDSWCDYEMNMALVESVETKRKLIIVVLMGDIEIRRLPIIIWRFLRNECLLEYPEREADRAIFWNDLATEINA